MSADKIETLLRQAPPPRVPDDLLERLEKDIELPEQGTHSGPTHGPSRIRYWVPVVSLAASVAVFAGVATVFFWQSPVAYSFEKSIEALRNVSGVSVVHRFRSGPPQPLKESAIGEGTTTSHPANPFATVETSHAVIDGREVSYSRGNHREMIRNGPLGLTTNLETGERDFYLRASFAMRESSLLDLESWFVDLEEQARNGEVEYEIKGKPDSSGNLVVVGRHRLFDNDEFFRFSVDAKTFLPVRYQVVSTGFPEFGDEVILHEYEVVDYGTDFPRDLFKIEPTDAELDKFGLTREELADLPPSTTSIEVSGEAGVSFVGFISDDTGEREIAGELPVTFVEIPEGVLHIGLRRLDGESATFHVRIGGGDSMGQGKGVIIYVEDDGSGHGISVVPSTVEDVDAFMKRNR